LNDGVAAARLLLAAEPRPTAIIGVNDMMAIGALQAAAQAGLRVPEDLSVAGFDNIEMAVHLVPPLTTVGADGQAMGHAAAELLFSRLRDPDRAPCRIERPTQLVIRESTGPCPAV
ncbi:MAG: substrate-binding domain-containing protein, partial [Anaerolineae bacterium]